jgi:hypothetical protein
MVWKKVDNFLYSPSQSIWTDLIFSEIDAQREAELDEKQTKYQTWQQEGNTIYILYTHQQG